MLINRCDICGTEIKTAQGLAGHKRFRHGPAGLASELETTLVSRQLHRKVFGRLSDRLADKLADAILESHGEEMLEVCLLELSRQGVDLSFSGRRRNIRAIIVAAGQNDRLLPLIPDKPVGLLEIGKGEVSPQETLGEFIGLARFTIAGAELMKAAYHHAMENPDRPYPGSPRPG